MRFDLPKPVFNKEYFLLLLPVFFVWHGFVENYVSVSIKEILILLVQYVSAIVILLIVFYFVFRSWRKTSVFVFLLMAYFFFFGAMHDFAKRLLDGSFFVKYSFILPFSLIFFIAAAIFLKRTKAGWNRLTQFLNLLFIVLILVELPFLFTAINQKGKYPPLEMGLKVCDSCEKPDVFLIVADGYAGTRELKETFQFDNSRFEKQLRSKGFHIVKDPRSNYNLTPFSMASALSMNYLRNIEGRNQSRKDMNICWDLINHNHLWNFFRKNGYSIINNSIFHVDDKASKFSQSFIFMGTKLITSQTFISRFNADIRFNLVTKFKLKSEIRRISLIQQKSNQKTIQHLIKEAQTQSDKPKFVYTHLLMPHYPYYFNSKGETKSIEYISDTSNFRNQKDYLEYLQYSNKQIIELIDTIINNSRKPPVIIFLSDHGFRMFPYDADKEYYFMNFNSILLPSRKYDQFYYGMSNINQFRILLNTEFGQRLPMLKDSLSFLIE